MICAAALFQQCKSFVRLHDPVDRIAHRLRLDERYLFLFNNSRTCSIVSGCVLSVERLLTFAFVQKGPVTCIRARGDLFAGLRCVTNAAGGLICVGSLGICKCLL